MSHVSLSTDSCLSVVDPVIVQVVFCKLLKPYLFDSEAGELTLYNLPLTELEKPLCIALFRRLCALTVRLTSTVIFYPVNVTSLVNATDCPLPPLFLGTKIPECMRVESSETTPIPHDIRTLGQMDNPRNYKPPFRISAKAGDGPK